MSREPPQLPQLRDPTSGRNSVDDSPPTCIKIEITKDLETGALEVWQDGKTTGQICVGEMFEQIVALLSPLPTPKGGYQMLTPAEWEARRNRHRSEAGA